MRIVVRILAAALAMAPAASFAQESSPVARADFAVGTGVLGATHAEASRYDRRAQSAFADVGAGVYWTDHFKTEAGGAVSNRSRSDRP